MKDYDYIKKGILIAVILGVAIFQLAGCKPKEQQDVNTTGNQSQQENSNNLEDQEVGSRQFNQEERNARIKSGLDGLVSEGVINAEQAEKITQQLIMPREFNGRQRQEGEQGQENVQRLNGERGQVRIRRPEGEGNQEREQIGDNESRLNDGQPRRISPLAKLVEDGVITEEQSDTVMKVIFQRPDGQRTTGN